eukprot:COSAG05_NODE_8931_length_660_cov_1.361854_1_plen_53_part_00
MDFGTGLRVGPVWSATHVPVVLDLDLVHSTAAAPYEPYYRYSEFCLYYGYYM